MTQIHWATARSGNFGTAADWTGGVVPGASDDAILNAAGATRYTVTVTADGTVSSIQTLSTATLEVKAGSASGGFTAGNGSGGGLNAGAILVADGGEFIFGGAIDNTGKINVTSTGDATELAIGAGGGTLTGAGHLTLSDSADNLVEATAPGATFVNDGNIVSGAGTIGGGGLSLVNDAHSRIESAGVNALVIDAASVVNAGTLELTNPGQVTSGGLILDGSTIDNVGGQILANGAGTEVVLETTTVIGGILRALSGGVITTEGGGDTLSGASGDVIIESAVEVANGTSLTVGGGMELVGGDGGEIALGGSSATTQLLVAAGGAQLVHLGSVVLSDSADNDIAASSAGAQLDVSSATISGGGTIGGGGLDLILNAHGLVDATGTANALVLNTGAYSIANGGVIEATGAAGLVIDSNVRDTGAGEIKVLDGSSLTTNNATITGGTLLVGTGSSVDLDNVETVGVTLTTQGTGTISLGGSSLSKDKLAGNFDIQEGTDLYVSGALAFSGRIYMIDNAESENGTQIRLKGSTEFEGGGEVYMGGSIWNQNFINGAGNPTVSGKATGYVLTNLDDTIAGAGNLGIGGLGQDWLTIVNDASGVIDGNAAVGQLVLSTGGNSTVINAGTLEGASAGGLVINAAVANTGTVLAANGGVVELVNNASITGGIVETSGTGVVGPDGGADFTNVDNKGQVAIGDGDILYITGSLVNSGAITLAGYNHGANLDASGTVTLTGLGKVVMAGTAPWNNDMAGDFVNVSNTVSGGGTISGTFLNDAGGIIDGASKYSDLVLNGLTLTNLGLMEASGGGGLDIVAIQVADTGGTIMATAASNVTLNNSGIVGGDLKSSGSGLIDVVGYPSTWTTVTNTASVYVDHAHLYLDGLITNSGSIKVLGALSGGGSGGATLAGAGHVLMTGTAPWNNSLSGDIINVSNTIAGGGTISGTFLNEAGGIVDGDNTAGDIAFNNGAFTNEGLIEATGGGGVDIVQTTVTNTGGSILATAGSNVTLNNSGVVGGVLAGSGTGTVDIVGYPSTWTNLANSANVYVDRARLYLDGLITNTGSISVVGALTGGGATLSGAGHVLMVGTAPWNNAISGHIVNQSNTIAGGGTISGTFANESGGIVDGDTSLDDIAFSGATVTNAGLIESTGAGGINIVQSTITNTGGTILATSGTTVTINNSEIIGGVLAGAGTGGVDITGYPSTWIGVTNSADVYMGDGPNLYLGGVIDNTGTITMEEGGHGGGVHVSGGSATLTGTGVIDMTGTGPWNDQIGGSGILTNAQTIMGGGTIGNGLSVVNAAGGVIEGSSSLDGLTLNAATLTNAGVLTSIAGGSLVIAVAVTNTGTIESAGGVTEINAGLSGAGKLIIDGGTLMVDTGAAVSEAATFQGTGGELLLYQSQSFTGRIAGFTTTGSTVLDLRDVAFVSAGEATFVENAAGTSGTLTVSADGAKATLTLAGDYAGDTFTASSDGSGGVEIVASPPPGVAPISLVAAMAAMTSGSAAAAAQPPSVHPQAATTLLAHTGGV